MSRNTLVLIWALLSLSLGAFQWHRHSSQQSIILITVDSLNKRILQKPQFKYFQRLSQNAIECTSTITTVPNTLPAHASLMTGLYPYEHGVRINERNYLSQYYNTLAELFFQKNFFTAALFSNHSLSHYHHLNQGFQHYEITADSTKSILKKAMTLLEEQRKKTFLWISLSDLRYPYHPPEEKLRNKDFPYEGGLQHLESCLEHFSNYLKHQYSKNYTLIIVGAYGESLGSFQEQESGYFVQKATLEVPLFFQSSSLKPQKIEFPVSIIDLFPTIHHLGLGSTVPSTITHSGLDLVPFFKNKNKTTPERWLYFENLTSNLSCGWAPFHGLQNKDFKFVSESTQKLFDLKDETESIDISSKHPELFQKLSKKLKFDFLANGVVFSEKLGGKQEPHETIFLDYFHKPYLETPTSNVSPIKHYSSYLAWKNILKNKQLSTKEYLKEMKKIEPPFEYAYGFYRSIAEKAFRELQSLPGASQQMVQQAVDKMNEIKPKHFFSTFTKGELLFLQKNWDPALKIFLNVLNHFPHNPLANYYVGSIYYIKQDPGALQFLKRYLEIAPENSLQVQDAQLMLRNFKMPLKTQNK